MVEHTDIDDIKCLKQIFKHVLIDDEQQSILNVLQNAIIRTSKIVYDARVLLRFYLLEHRENIQELPLHDTKFLQKFFDAVTTRSNAGRKSISYQEHVQSIQDIMHQCYPIETDDLTSKTNLSRTLANEVNRLKTEIGNHVKFRYIQFLETFLNNVLKQSDKFKTATKEKQKQLFRDKKKLFMTLVKNELPQDMDISELSEIYGDTQEYVAAIFDVGKKRKRAETASNETPNKKGTNSQEEHLENTEYQDQNNQFNELKRSEKPLSYHVCEEKHWGTFLKSMINMVSILENKGIKKFQFFPISKGTNQLKHIDIDPAIFHEIVMKSKYNKDIAKEQFLKHLKVPKYKKGYVFNDRISTDGYSVTFQYRPEAGYNKKQETSRKKYEGMLRKRQQQQQDDQHVVEEPQFRTTSTSFSSSLKQKNVKKERYLTDIVDGNDFSERTSPATKLIIDPGKRDLLYIIDDKYEPSKYKKRNLSPSDSDKINQRMTYSFRQRKHDLKTKELNEDLSSLKLKLEINESSLENLDAKSCCIDVCKEYFFEKRKLMKRYELEYRNIQFRKIKFRRKINEIKADDLLVSRIKKKFSKKNELNNEIVHPIVFLGDYAEDNVHKLRNFESTKGIGLRRLLQQNFETYLVDEFRTSKLSYKTEEECTPWTCKDEHFLNKLNEKRKLKYKKRAKGSPDQATNGEYHELTEVTLRSVLTFKLEIQRRDQDDISSVPVTVLINRDLNACLNMRKIVNSHLIYGTRPEKFRRSQFLCR